MTDKYGFLALLTPGQLAKALAYTGEDQLGVGEAFIDRYSDVFEMLSDG